MMVNLTESQAGPGPGRRLFEERRRELSGFLRRIEGTVNPLAAAADARLGRLRPVIANEVARLRERLDTLPTSAVPPWNELADLERLTSGLAEETLAVVGGISLRAAGLDGHAGDLAEALLARVAGAMTLGYTFITVPSGSEFIDLMSAVIRVRYPGTGVWDLPVVLHEFGHFLVNHLPRSAEPSVWAVVARERGKRPNLGYYAEELWADTFAAYVGGPAYACSALVRFDPASAAKDAPPHHPSAVKRAAVIFATLGRSQLAWQRRQCFAGSLAEPITLARDLWQARLAAAGVTTERGEDDLGYAERLADEYLAILDHDWPGIRYDNAKRTAAIRQSLEDGRPELPPEAGLIDVLNSGWWARRKAEVGLRDTGAIAGQIENLCAKVVGHG
jgi:hypothetical protein